MKTTKSAIAVSLFFCILLFAGWTQQALAATCTSQATGNWSNSNTWTNCGGSTPGSGDTAIIANTHNVTVNIATTVGAMTVNAGGTLTVPGANFTVNGATNVSGTLNHTNTGGSETYIGLVTINAGGVWNNNIGESITFRGGLTHNGASFTSGTTSGRMTFSTNSQAIGGTSPINFDRARVSGAITVTNNNTNIVTITGTLTGTVAGSTWVNGTNSTLNYSNAAQPMATGVLTASAAGNTVNYTGAAQTVKLPSASTYYHLTLSGSGAVTMPGSALTVSGNFTMSGTVSVTAIAALTVGGNFTVGAGTTFAAGTYAHAVGGNFSNSGTFTADTSTFTFNGAAAQSITGATTFYNVTMNNTSTGLTINNDVTVSNTLAFTNGVITTGSNTLIASLACNTPSVTGAAQATGWVAGNLRKRIPTGAPVSCTFEVGDATTYRPINTTFASVTTAGNVTGWSSQSAGDHPDTTNLLSGIDPLLSVNRYWTLTNSGSVFTTCSATFNFVAGDVDAGALYTSFIVALGSSCSGSGATRTCTSWTQPTVGTLGATSTQATGLTAFGDFAIGQARNPNFSREPQFIYTRELY